MQLKKLLALLLSAALALSLLAGCGGESVARSLLALLDGQYANVSVEMDPDLEADLRQALSETENDDEAAIRAALETLLGSTITFRYLGEGQQGDTAFDLIFYAGADPDKAAQSAYSQWNGTFSNLPDDGLYTAALAQVQTENGIWLLVQATVDKAASRDDDDDDDEPEEPEDPGYIVDEKGNYTVNTENGLQELFNDKNDSDFDGITITLEASVPYTVSQTFTTAFKGILKGESPEKKATITLTDDCNGLFAQISGGTVENITFDVQTNITGTTRAGAVADQNNGTIQNCDVTISGDYTIQATSDGISAADAGGLVGLNDGTITNCTVTINGSISATGYYAANAGGIVGTNESGHEISGCKVTIKGGSITATNDINGRVYAGGIAGENQGTISNCDVEGSYSSDSSATADISAATNGDNAACAGGIAGYNQGTVDDKCSVTNCKIEAGGYVRPTAAGGIVGLNESGNVASNDVTDYYITAMFGDTPTSATVTDSSEQQAIQDQLTGVCAGAKIGNNDGAGPVGR